MCLASNFWYENCKLFQVSYNAASYRIEGPEEIDDSKDDDLGDASENQGEDGDDDEDEESSKSQVQILPPSHDSLYEF